MNKTCFGVVPRRSREFGCFNRQNFLAFNVGIPEWVNIDRFTEAMPRESFPTGDCSAVEGACHIGTHKGVIFPVLAEGRTYLLDWESVPVELNEDLTNFGCDSLMDDERSVAGFSRWMVVWYDNPTQ